MVVRERDVAAIVLTLLAELDVRPGGRVTPSHLSRQWRGVGLRRDDLDRGIALLLRDGLLMEEDLPNQPPGYMLTRAGFRRMERLVSPLFFGMAPHQRLRRKAVRRITDGGMPGGQGGGSRHSERRRGAPD